MYINKQQVIDTIISVKEYKKVTDTFFDMSDFFDIGKSSQLILRGGVSNGTYKSVKFRCSDDSVEIMLNHLFSNLFDYVSPPPSYLTVIVLGGPIDLCQTENGYMIQFFYYIHRIKLHG